MSQENRLPAIIMLAISTGAWSLKMLLVVATIALVNLQTITCVLVWGLIFFVMITASKEDVGKKVFYYVKECIFFYVAYVVVESYDLITIAKTSALVLMASFFVGAVMTLDYANKS